MAEGKDRITIGWLNPAGNEYEFEEITARRLSVARLKSLAAPMGFSEHLSVNNLSAL